MTAKGRIFNHTKEVTGRFEACVRNQAVHTVQHCKVTKRTRRRPDNLLENSDVFADDSRISIALKKSSE